MPFEPTTVQVFILEAFKGDEEYHTVDLQRIVEGRLGKFCSTSAFIEQLHSLRDEGYLTDRVKQLDTAVQPKVRLYRLTERGKSQQATSTAGEVS